MNEKVAAAIAQEAIAKICQKGLLDLPRHSPENVKEIQLNIESAVFLGMKYMREACAGIIENGLGRIPDGLPSFVAEQATQALRAWAETMRDAEIAMEMLSAPLPAGKPPPQYVTQDDIEAAARDRANDMLRQMGGQPPVQFPPGYAKATRDVMTGLPHRGLAGVTSKFECHWCKEAGLPEAEYVKQGTPASADFYDRPLCKECTERLEPPPKRTPPAS